MQAKDFIPSKTDKVHTVMNMHTLIHNWGTAAKWLLGEAAYYQSPYSPDYGDWWVMVILP